MKNILEAFSILFVLLLSVYAGICVMTASAYTAAAKEYKADVIAEIENSNFAPEVVAACKAQAEAAGYTLEVTGAVYDENNRIQTAEVVLTYSYRLPMFGIDQSRTKRGIVR